MAEAVEIEIGWLKPSQTESMVSVLHELFDYYSDGESVPLEMVEAHLRTNLLSEESNTKLLVASLPNENIIGFAAISYLFSLVDPRPAHSKQCLLKELYVTNAYRSDGVGHLLMSRLISLAREEKCTRIDWNVKTHNDAGIRFYERYGATLVADRASYRISL